MEKKQTLGAGQNQQPPDLEFRIEAKKDSWLINGVREYGQDELWQVELYNGLLDNGTQRNYAECVAQARVAEKRGEYRAPSAPLQSGLSMTLYEHRNDKEHKKDVEAIRSFLQKQYKSNWLWTLSQVVYQPLQQQYKSDWLWTPSQVESQLNDEDTITHDVGLPSQRVVHYDVKGEYGPIKDISSADTALQQMFGIADAQVAQELGNWLTKDPTYLWRYPLGEITTPILCGVAVDGGGGGLGLVGDGWFGDHWPSLGVLVVGAKKIP